MDWKVIDLKQNPLQVGLRDDATFANFYYGRNDELLANLTQTTQSIGEKYFYLWGLPGSGCSHLLQACCHAAKQQKKAAIYLNLNSPHLTPEALDDLEYLDLVCLDELNSVAGNLKWEKKLFNLFNFLAEQKKTLIIAASCSVSALPIKLSDLKSRLNSGLIFQVHPLTDEEKILAWQMRAKNRGLNVAQNVITYLLKHQSRTMNDLLTILDQLDTNSLAAKRKITIPFAKEVLAGLKK